MDEGQTTANNGYAERDGEAVRERDGSSNPCRAWIEILYA